MDAILGGERGDSKLAPLRHYRIQADEDRQSREIYGNYQRQIEQCDAEIAQLSPDIPRKLDSEQGPFRPDPKKRRSRTGRNRNGEGFDMRTEVPI